MLKTSFFLLMFIVFGVVDSCGTSQEFKEFYALSRDKQKEQMMKMPIDKQIDFHLYAMRRHPADKRFAEDIAAQGENVVPDVIRRFRNEEKDYRKTDILYILVEICRTKKCEEDKELIAKVSNGISLMKDEIQKNYALKTLSFIKGEPQELPKVPEPPRG